jgi:hypothetical protein
LPLLSVEILYWMLYLLPLFCDLVLHGTMPLLGVDYWVPLSDLFVDVNILEELSSSRRSELDDLWQDFNQNPNYRSLDRIGLGRQQKRISGLEALKKNENLMVVGKPGSGKTTFLQHVVIECNSGNIQADRIPCLIKLRNFIEDGREFVEDGRKSIYPLKPYLEKCWQLSDVDVETLLKQGRLLLLLDGLDEVIGEDDDNKITKEIRRFARSYPHVQMIITCRIRNEESRFERFDYIEIADFNDWQVISFAKHWFKTRLRHESKEILQAKDFLELLFSEENKLIQELAITPILLSLTCEVFFKTGRFYSKRSKLYEEGLNVLLRIDESRKVERDEIYRDLPQKQKLELLKYLALRQFKQPQYALFKQSELESYIADFLDVGEMDSRDILNAIETHHGLLIKRSQNIWSFSHLTFQEYLVAQCFSKRSNIENLSKYFIEPHWKEVYLIASETINKPQDFAYFLEKCKETVDTNFLTDFLQDILIRLHQKSENCRSIFNQGIVRAFYFDISFLRTIYTDDIIENGKSSTPAWFNLPSSDFATLLGDFKLTLLLNHDIFICFDFGFISYDPKENAFGDVCNLLQVNTKNELEIDLLFANILIILTSFTTDYAKLASKDVYSKSSSILIKILQILSDADLDNELKEFCKNLVDDINTIKISKKKFQAWFQNYGSNKVCELRYLLEKYRYIKWEWNLTTEELHLQRKYYEANILLVECLNISNSVDHKFKEEIIANFLLPVTEIENRSRKIK